VFREAFGSKALTAFTPGFVALWRRRKPETIVTFLAEAIDGHAEQTEGQTQLIRAYLVHMFGNGRDVKKHFWFATCQAPKAERGFHPFGRQLATFPALPAPECPPELWVQNHLINELHR